MTASPDWAITMPNTTPNLLSRYSVIDSMGVPFMTRFGYVERPCGGIVAPNAAIALKFIQPDEAFGCVTGKGNVLYPNIVAMLYHPQSLL